MHIKHTMLYVNYISKQEKKQDIDMYTHKYGKYT